MESLAGYDAWLEEPYQAEDEDAEERRQAKEDFEFDKGWDSDAVRN